MNPHVIQDYGYYQQHYANPNDNKYFMSPEILPSRLLSPPMMPQFIYPPNYGYFQGILPNPPMNSNNAVPHVQPNTAMRNINIRKSADVQAQKLNLAKKSKTGGVNPLSQFRPKKDPKP